MSADPARLLVRALQRSGAAAACVIEVTVEATTPWSSATFVGAQHRIAVRGTGLDAWLADLSEADLPMRGCFVASCAVESSADGAVLTLLVLDE